MNKYLVFMGIGFELLGLIGAAIYLGQFLGDSKELGTAGLILLGMVGWFVHIIYLFRKTK